MKRKFRYRIQFILLLTVTSALSSFSQKTGRMMTPGNLKYKSEWVRKHLTGNTLDLPFSFVFNGKPSADLLNNWQEKSGTTSGTNSTLHDQFWTDQATGLEVHFQSVEYKDFPVTEWTVYFKNTGGKNTPVLEAIQGLHTSLQRNDEGEFILHGIKGDFCTADSYEPFQQILKPSSVRKFAPIRSGKSSNGPDGWPYYNLQFPGGGVILAIGWPGQWACSFTRDSLNGLEIQAGQQRTHLYLKPGEQVRTPSVTLLFWKGSDVVAAQNLWRRFYLTHIIPRVDGKPQIPVMQIQVGGSLEDTVMIREFLKAGIHPDICWRDAGGRETWYPSDSGPYKGDDAWLNTGTWMIDPRRYPDGFSPFSDWVHANGMKFLLWFEPERVGNPDSWLSKNHPEWLLPGTSHGALLNEGNPEALNWLVCHVDSLIKSQGIDWYREDMNGGGPLPAWNKNDSADRQGITENLYVQGHLAFWDELRRLNPRLRIDACASGGRRNDLETMRRAVPLLRSDFQWPSMAEVIEGNQGQTFGLSSWLPFQGTGAYLYDPYSFRSFYMPGFGMGGINPENCAAQQQAYEECSQIAPVMLYGDYFPLTPYSLQKEKWIAWQFNRIKEGDGMIQAFRRVNCAESEISVFLKGLNPGAQYEIRNFDTPGKMKISGKILMQKGLKIEISKKPGAAVIMYRRIK